MKLISTTDFVIKQYKEHPFNCLKRIVNYTKFLKQPLTLGMFVPVDDKGNILNKPKQYEGALEFAIGKDYEDALKYQQAKERVLFEGLSITLAKTIVERYSGMGVEGLLNIDREITLTESAIKQIGL